MKRLVVTFLALFYLTVASGATVNLHYCMNKLVDWSLSQSNADTCSACGMKKQEPVKKSCCKDVQHHSKIDFAKNTDLFQFDFQQNVCEQPNTTTYDFSAAVNLASLPVCSLSSAPPTLGDLPIFIKNCTFRI
jgi:hypothetical protein